jgi:hypothetical protein
MGLIAAGRRWILIVLLSAVCIATGVCEEGGGKLLGKWRSVTVSKGGIGALLNFYADGRFDYMPAAIVAGQYRVEGEKVITALDDGEPEYAMTIKSVTAETLGLVMREKLPSLDLKRVGRPEDPDHPLLGTWVSTATVPGMPAHGYYYFRNNGRETLVIPFRTDHCKYSISGDQIRLVQAGGDSKEGPFRWEGDVLVLPWHRGEAKFERF